MSITTPRWVHRFDNFTRACALLTEAVQTSQARSLSLLEQEGLVQRFEYTWELAWKLLKDYLEHSGVVLDTITPAAVIKAALMAKFIHEGETWMLALDARNRMSHSYSQKAFEQTITQISTQFLPLLQQLDDFMVEKLAQEQPDAS